MQHLTSPISSPRRARVGRSGILALVAWSLFAIPNLAFGAQPRVAVETAWETFPIGARIDDALTVEVTSSDGQRLPEDGLKVSIAASNSVRFYQGGEGLSAAELELLPNEEGLYPVSLDFTGPVETRRAIFEVRVQVGTAEPFRVQRVFDLEEPKVVPALTDDPFLLGKKHIDAVKLVVMPKKQPGSASATLYDGTEFQIRVQGRGGVYTATDPEAQRFLKVKASSLGAAHLSLDLSEVDKKLPEIPLVLEVTALRAGRSLTADPLMVSINVASPSPKDLRSHRTAAELFLGSTFRYEFDDEGNSDGFGEADPVVRLNVDHVWGINKGWDLHGSFRALTSSFASQLDQAEAPTASADTLMGRQTVPGSDDGEQAEDEEVKFVDFYSGSINLLYQPRWMARIKPTSRDTDRPYDVSRLGFFTRAGFITRENVGINGDTSLGFFNVGLAFTLHQTAAPTLEEDNFNTFPVLFTEVSYASYEEFGPRTNWHDRLVVDAGFRLANTGGGLVPFYVGLHLNAGKGVDDHRIYAGFLFHLDRLRRLAK